ncbi:MAG: hypothetical protein FGM58_05915 [Acidimicrobiia bacterium]|nr:hypothetical protein [Acidimicrobiia bacterium]
MIDEAPSVLCLLPMPKTGGSSLTYSLKWSPDHVYVQLPLSSVAPDACECGAESGCVDHRDRQRIDSWNSEHLVARPLVVKLHHESYDAVEWVLGPARQDSAHRRVALPVRERRARLRSMFTDYWTQVSIAAGLLTDDMPSSAHRMREFQRYSADSLHYRRADGSIDGVAWFSSFQRHGAGLPFFLDEVFGGDVGRLERELDVGRLRLVSTSGLDAYIEECTGRPALAAKRVSRTDRDPAVAAALADAAHLIEELAERDAPFDRFIADHLGEPDFFVE